MSPVATTTPSVSKFVRGSILVPVITIFNDDVEQTLNIADHKKHILWMAQSGVQGFVCQGSTAEAVSLLPEEKITLIKATREVLDENGFKHLHIMAGAGADSTKEAILLAKQAASAGADSILSLPPSYFAPSLTREALESYYLELADNSPVPVFIYSWPGVSSGLEMDSDFLIKVAQHPNIAGYKGTDHNVGKMARVRAAVTREDFYVLTGATDYFLGALACGVDGTITGVAQVTPRLVVELSNTFYAGDLKKAQKLQGDLSQAEWALLSGGIPSLKYAVNKFRGYGGIPRRPLPESPAPIKKRIDDYLKGIVAHESSLAKLAGAK